MHAYGHRWCPHSKPVCEDIPFRGGSRLSNLRKLLWRSGPGGAPEHEHEQRKTQPDQSREAPPTEPDEETCPDGHNPRTGQREEREQGPWTIMRPFHGEVEAKTRVGYAAEGGEDQCGTTPVGQAIDRQLSGGGRWLRHRYISDGDEAVAD